MKSQVLQKHVTATYVNLRIGMAAIAMVLPNLLWVGGALQGLVRWFAVRGGRWIIR